MINESIQIQIRKLSDERYDLIDIKESTWNKDTESYDGIDEGEYDARIDEYAIRIHELIQQFNIELPFEFIIDELTKLGGAPCLLYDDNAHFAVVGDCVATVCEGEEPEDCALQFFVPADHWKNSPREALEYYLNNED